MTVEKYVIFKLVLHTQFVFDFLQKIFSVILNMYFQNFYLPFLKISALSLNYPKYS